MDTIFCSGTIQLEHPKSCHHAGLNPASSFILLLQNIVYPKKDTICQMFRLQTHGNVKVGIGYSASNLLVYDFDSQMECDQ
jgi:hypothetical protein